MSGPIPLSGIRFVVPPLGGSSVLLSKVSVRAIFNPNEVVSPVRRRAATPLGLAGTTRFSQGSSRLATLGFGAESLWDSALESAKGIDTAIGRIPAWFKRAVLDKITSGTTEQ